MDKFKNKYRIQSHRKPNWDYSADALYYLTIVTQNRECNLGKIENNEMILSDFGKIVEQEWYQSFEIRSELILHNFILMPNHLHTIVEIYNPNRDEMVDGVMHRGDMDCGGTAANTGAANIGSANTGAAVQTHGRVSLPTVRLPQSISSFIAGFKSAVNSKIDDYIDKYQLSIPKYNRNNHFFQPNYHDHIIRNDIEYQYISNYIINNPINWGKDKFYG